MKTFLLTLISLFFLNGCSSHNAFGEFDLTPAQELSEDNIQTVKIKDSKKVHGILSVVYLNKVFPERYKNAEYFYVYYYLRDANESVTFELNSKPSLLKEALPPKNKFSTLTSFEAPWSKYYLLRFKKEGNVLNFKVTTDKAANATLQFIKDK